MPTPFIKRDIQFSFLRFNLVKVCEAWEKYSRSLDGDKINVTWGVDVDDTINLAKIGLLVLCHVILKRQARGENVLKVQESRIF
jgi:hypothetical protein